MARRSSLRIPISLNVRCKAYNKVYSGTVTNISENGMFVKIKEKNIPEDAHLTITIQLKEDSLHVPVKLIRLKKNDGECEGIGVELSAPPQKYLDFVENLMLVL
ncbi:MAG: PilZ domain-containing protein [Nitrospirae bacterium]|nr:PilZ domain-containing protein [Nitrospirota bacterium]